MYYAIEMLPAADGDCLWIEYGDPQNPCRILIDGGRANTGQEIINRIRKAPVGRIHFELVVITHVDRDHVAGILNLLCGGDRLLSIGDIWFNGWHHLDESRFEAFSPIEGEKLTKAILSQGLPWNEKFRRKAVTVSKDTVPQPIPCKGGMEITILSPSPGKLLSLKPKWAEACRAAGIDPQHIPLEEAPSGFEQFGPIDIEELAASDFSPDVSESNGSSIAFLAKFDGHTILLSGDAHPDLLLESIKTAKNQTSKLTVDAFKIPHHGSKANISRDILESVDCPRYLISTSGAYHQHPDPEALARIIKYGRDDSELIFNYKSKFTQIWENTSWMNKYRYTVRYLEDPNMERSIKLA